MDINNDILEYNYIIGFAMYINFFYEDIVSEPYMLDYLVNSSNQINKLALNYSTYTRRQIESIYIALTLYLLFMWVRIN